VSSTEVTLHTPQAPFHPRTTQSSKFLKLLYLCINLVSTHHLFLLRSPLTMPVTNYTDNEITKLDLGVLHWGHFAHTICTNQPKNHNKLKFTKNWPECKNLIVGHHLFLYKSPLIVTINIHIEIRELDLDDLHWSHFTHPHAPPPPKNKTKLKISIITSLCRKMVAGHPLFLHRSPLTVTYYFDVENLYLGVLHWGHFTHTSCTTQEQKKLRISKIISLCKNLVVGHHLLLHMSPLNVTVTNYINSDIRELNHRVLHRDDFKHTSCTAPPHPRTRQSLKFLKVLLYYAKCW